MKDFSKRKKKTVITWFFINENLHIVKNFQFVTFIFWDCQDLCINDKKNCIQTVF